MDAPKDLIYSPKVLKSDNPESLGIVPVRVADIAWKQGEKIVQKHRLKIVHLFALA